MNAGTDKLIIFTCSGSEKDVLVLEVTAYTETKVIWWMHILDQDTNGINFSFSRILVEITHSEEFWDFEEHILYRLLI